MERTRNHEPFAHITNCGGRIVNEQVDLRQIWVLSCVGAFRPGTKSGSHLCIRSHDHRIEGTGNPRSDGVDCSSGYRLLSRADWYDDSKGKGREIFEWRHQRLVIDGLMDWLIGTRAHIHIFLCSLVFIGVIRESMKKASEFSSMLCSRTLVGLPS